MFLYLILYLACFTNFQLHPSLMTTKRSTNTVDFKDLPKLKTASQKIVESEQPNEIKTTSNPVTNVGSNLNSRTIENSLDLSRTIFLNKPKLISTDTISSTIPSTIVLKTQPTQGPDLLSLESEFEKALKIYNQFKNNHVQFINAINTNFKQNYTYNTLAENVLGDIIGNMFQEIVKTNLKSSWFSNNIELFLHKNLEEQAITNYKVAMSIQDTLIKIINCLDQIKSTVLNNENKDLQINYFNQNTLPIDNWIRLTKELSEKVKSLIPQTKEKRDEKDIQSLQPLAQVFKEHQKIKSDWNKGLEELFQQAEEEQKEILQRQKNTVLEKTERDALEKYMQFEAKNLKALEEQRKQKEDFFNKSKDLVEANTLKNLQSKINENFEILKQREKEIQLPKELIKINILLNTIQILLTDKKDNSLLKESFTVLLNAVYQELISPSIIKRPPFLLTGKKTRDEEEESNPDSYILKDEFYNARFYKPLYDIIIYKLNTLLLLYATVTKDVQFEKNIEITLRFIESNEIKKYSFSTSIFNLIALNANAEFYNGSLLKSKAHPLEIGKILSIGARYLGKKINNTLDIFGQTGEELGQAGEELIKLFAKPITWVNSFFEESQKAKEEARKKKEKEQQYLKDELDKHNKLLQNLIESLNPQGTSKESAELTPKGISRQKETTETKPDFAKAFELINSSDERKETPKVLPLESQEATKTEPFNWRRALFGDTSKDE